MRIKPTVKFAVVSVLMLGACFVMFCFEPPLYLTRTVQAQANTSNGVPVVAHCYNVLSKPELMCLHLSGGSDKWPAWFIVDRKLKIVGTRSPYNRLWFLKTVNSHASTGVNITSPKMGTPWHIDWTTNHVQFSNEFVTVKVFQGRM